jgi:hypothetical protein
MRTALIPYQNQYVLAKGWITDWSDDEERQSRRVYVSNVTIKKADKNLTFENQRLISKEEHLNFFIPLQYVSTIPCEKYNCLAIAAYIREYTRKDGSIDYGLKLIEQSMVEDHIQQIYEESELMTEGELLTPHSLATLLSLKRKLIDCGKELEDTSDLLPTFFRTYGEYKKEIKNMINVLDESILLINSICSNRAMRRKHKIKKNFARPVNQFYSNLMQSML